MISVLGQSIILAGIAGVLTYGLGLLLLQVIRLSDLHTVVQMALAVIQRADPWPRHGAISRRHDGSPMILTMSLHIIMLKMPMSRRGASPSPHLYFNINKHNSFIYL